MLETKIANENELDKKNRELCIQIKNNVLSAENELLKMNEGLIQDVVSKLVAAKGKDDYMPVGAEKDDLIQEGRLAMLSAAKNFNSDMETKFSTYAYTIINNAMVDAYRKGLSTFEVYMERKGLRRIFLDDLDRDEKEEVYNSVGKPLDLEWHDPSGNMAVKHVMIEKMGNRLELLTDRQRRLIEYMYGLSNQEMHTISETAALYHITEKEVKHLEKSSLKVLRYGMNDGKIV